MFLKFILILFASTIVFDFLLMYLNKNNNKITVLLQKTPKKWKGKLWIKWTFRLNFILILLFLQIVVGANEILITLLLGLTLSISDFIFNKPKKVD